MKDQFNYFVFLCLTLAWAGWGIDLATLPANTWIQRDPAYDGAPNGGVYPYEGYQPQGWNNNGVYDPASGRTIIFDRWVDTLRNGKVGVDYAGSIYANALLAYDPVTNVVTVLKVCNWRSMPTNSVCVGSVCGNMLSLPENHTDTTPMPRHPLGTLSIIPELHKAFVSNGLNQGACFGGAYGNAITDTWAYDLTSGHWQVVSDLNTTPPNPGYTLGTAMIYDSASHVLVLFNDKYFNGPETWLFDPSAGAAGEWSLVTNDASADGIHTYGSGLAYDSKRGRILKLGCGWDWSDQYTSGNLSAYSVAENKWTHLTDCPVKAPQPGFAYDSKNDIFLALIGDSTWVYNPRTDSWTGINAPLTRVVDKAAQPVVYNRAWDVFVFSGGNAGYAVPQWCIFRYDSLTVSSETVLSPSSASQIRAFPNPCQNSGQSVLFTALAPTSCLKIYSTCGRLVRTLATSGKSVAWDLKDGQGKSVVSGIYLYQAESGALKDKAGKLTLMR